VCTTGDMAHIDTIFKLLPHTRQLTRVCQQLVTNVCNHGEHYETPCICFLIFVVTKNRLRSPTLNIHLKPRPNNAYEVGRRNTATGTQLGQTAPKLLILLKHRTVTLHQLEVNETGETGLLIQLYSLLCSGFCK